MHRSPATRSGTGVFGCSPVRSRFCDESFQRRKLYLKAQLPTVPAFDGLRARQQWLAAYLQVEQGNAKAGREALVAARQLAQSDPDIALEIDRLDGQALLRLGEWSQGEELLNRVLTIAEQNGDRYDQAMALNDLGRGRMARNRYDEALQYFDRVMAMPDASEWSIYALSSRNAGSCYQRLGQFDRAVALQEKALAIQERRGKREYFVQALGELGNLYALRGDPERALPYLQRGLAEAKNANVTSEIPRLTANLASVELDLGRWDDAERHNQEAEALWMAGHPAPSPYHLLNSALIAKGRERFDEANELFSQVLAAPGVAPSTVWDAHFNLANVALAQKQPERAAAEFEAALSVIETTRAGLVRTDDKVAYLTRLITFYQEYVSALISQGHADRALEVADSSRGQLLAERQRTAGPGRVKASAFQRVARESGAVMLSVLARTRTVVALGDLGQRRAAGALAETQRDRTARRTTSGDDRRCDGRSAWRRTVGRRQAVSDARAAGGQVDFARCARDHRARRRAPRNQLRDAGGRRRRGVTTGSTTSRSR